MKKSKKMAIIITTVAVILALAITASVCIIHYLGIPKCVGDNKFNYKISTLHVKYNGIDLYGKAIVPCSDTQTAFPLVIYAHGANSSYSADMSTLKSLAASGIACYTFDFYGWTNRSSGPLGNGYFKGTPKSNNDAYVTQLFSEINDLNAVIDATKTWNFVNKEKIFLLGSSMGGAVVATCAISHSDDITAIILQYPAINLNADAMVAGSQYDVNGYLNDVLLLQGTSDVIVSQSMTEELLTHYNSQRQNHATIVIYDNQPHVFTGKYKVIAASDIFDFITLHLN